MIRLGALVGADVPFFLSGTPFAIGRGRGECCEPVPSTATFSHVLVNPQARLRASDIYTEGQFTLTASSPSISMVLHALCNGSLGELAKGLYNVLEPEAIRRCPAIDEIKTHLRQSGCPGALSSGSGPTVFGLCRDAAHARQVAQRLRKHGSPQWAVRVVRTLCASPRVRRRGEPGPRGLKWKSLR